MGIAGADAFPEQTRLLTRFLDQLKNWHTKHNTTLFATGKKQGLRERKKKRKESLGPTVGSIHLVPYSEPKDGYAHTHLHLELVTKLEHGTRRLHHRIQMLYERAKQQLGMTYVVKGTDPEIT